MIEPPFPDQPRIAFPNRIEVDPELPTLGLVDSVPVEPEQSAVAGVEAEQSASKLQRCAAWLRAALLNGPRPGAELERVALESGHSPASYRRARTLVGVVTIKSRTADGEWWTALAEPEQEQSVSDGEWSGKQGFRSTVGPPQSEPISVDPRAHAEPSDADILLAEAQQRLTVTGGALQRQQVVQEALEAQLPASTLAALCNEAGAAAALTELEAELGAVRAQVGRLQLAAVEAERLVTQAAAAAEAWHQAQREERTQQLLSDREGQYAALEEAVAGVVTVVRVLGVISGELRDGGKTTARITNFLNTQLFGAGLREMRLPPGPLRGPLTTREGVSA